MPARRVNAQQRTKRIIASNSRKGKKSGGIPRKSLKRLDILSTKTASTAGGSESTKFASPRAARPTANFPVIAKGWASAPQRRRAVECRGRSSFLPAPIAAVALELEAPVEVRSNGERRRRAIELWLPVAAIAACLRALPPWERARAIEMVDLEDDVLETAVAEIPAAAAGQLGLFTFLEKNNADTPATVAAKASAARAIADRFAEVTR